MTPHSQYKRIALYSIVQDEDGYVIKNDLCLCEHCKVNGFLCPRHPVAEPCASHSSAPTEQEIREKVLDDLWKFCLINGAEEHGDLIGLPKDPFFPLKLVKKIAEMRYELRTAPEAQR